MQQKDSMEKIYTDTALVQTYTNDKEDGLLFHNVIQIGTYSHFQTLREAENKRGHRRIPPGGCSPAQQDQNCLLESKFDLEAEV